MTAWGSPVEVERKRRIDLAVWAYSYEFEADSLVPDDVFDQTALLVDPSMDTGNEKMDTFFRTEFQPDTGQWVQSHPDIPGLKKIYLLKKKG